MRSWRRGRAGPFARPSSGAYVCVRRAVHHGAQDRSPHDDESPWWLCYARALLRALRLALARSLQSIRHRCTPSRTVSSPGKRDARSLATCSFASRGTRWGLPWCSLRRKCWKVQQVLRYAKKIRKSRGLWSRAMSRRRPGAQDGRPLSSLRALSSRARPRQFAVWRHTPAANVI